MVSTLKTWGRFQIAPGAGGKGLASSARAIALGAAVLPLAAAAQPAPVNYNYPMTPMARTGPPSDGITVSANGYADAPADSANVVIYLNSQKAPITPALLAPLIDALVNAGIPRSEIGSSLDMTGQAAANNASLMLKIDRPTADRVRAALPAIALAAAQTPIENGNANVQLFYDACDKLIAAARANAIASARKRAEEIASTLGVKAGAVKAFADTEPPMDAQGHCVSNYAIPGYGAQRPKTPEDFVTVRVTVQVTLRYAIR